MVEALLADVDEACHFGLRFRDVETCDCAAVSPRHEIKSASSVQLARSRPRASAPCPGKYPTDPHYGLVEQARQFGEIARRESSRPDGWPAQPYFKLWMQRADQRHSSSIGNEALSLSTIKGFTIAAALSPILGVPDGRQGPALPEP